jgi:hypothetical protein
MAITGTLEMMQASHDKEFRLIALPDNMDNWDPLIALEAQQIWTVYFFDPNEKTHCCEITPSYWLEFLDSFFERDYYDANGDLSRENERERDGLEESIRTGQIQCDPSCYVHCHEIDHLFEEKNKYRDHFIAKWRGEIPAFGWSDTFAGDDDKERRENAREYWQGSPPFAPLEIDAVMKSIRRGESFDEVNKWLRSHGK